jgi:predicted component of type VI protein secretion system
MDVKLLVLSGKHHGREIPLPQRIFLVGRDPRCHLRPHCSIVSRRHCAIANWAGCVYLRDLKSSHGTFLNGKKIAGQVLVQDGDVLRVGDLELAFSIVGATPGQDEIRPLRKTRIKWLLQASAGDAAECPTGEQKVTVLVEPGESLPSGSSRDGRGSDLSAGQYLKDVVRPTHVT